MVSKHWANALMQEWTAQALLEREYHLKQTVMSSDDPLQEAESQIIFISLFAKPLLELTVRAAPNLAMYYHHCKANLLSWHQRKAVLCNQYGSGGTTRKSSSPPLPPPSSSPCLPPVRQSDGYHSAFPLALPNYRPKSDNNSSRTSTSRSSDLGSQPQSPCESESVSSAMLSPISDASFSYHSSSASTSSTQNHIPSSHAAIRAASKSGSLKLQAQKNKKGNRNSWSSTSTSAASGMDVTLPFTLTPTTKSSSSSTSSTPPLDNTSTFSSSSLSSCPGSLLTTPPTSRSTTPSTTPSVATVLTSRPIKIQVAP